MHAYARLKPGAGFQLDRALFYYAQRMVTSASARRAVAAVIAAGLKSRHGRGAELGPDFDCGRAIDDLNRDGIAKLAPVASQDAIKGMVSFLSGQKVVGPDGKLTTLDNLPANTATAAYSCETILECPGVLEALNAPSVLRIVTDYLGCKPTLSSIGVRWSFPSENNVTDTQRFHRDVDDWRFVKLFVYLTDVDERSGPHAYVRTSHKTSFGMKAKAYTLGDIERRFGAQSLDTVLGPAGTTFMADTQGVHCGVVPVDRPRLILQAQYSLLPVFAFLYDPVERDELSEDAYVNRLVVRRNPSPHAELTTR